MGLQCVLGDLTQLNVDAIVNAANETLLGGGGVDGAIHRAAGPELLRACEKIPRGPSGFRCEIGEAKLTPGFDLPASWVIHTVGPMWDGGDQGESEELARCYRSALELAAQQQIRSIAFPAISTGVFGFPKDLAATIAIQTCMEALESYSFQGEILLCAHTQQHAYLLQSTLEKYHASH